MLLLTEAQTLQCYVALESLGQNPPALAVQKVVLELQNLDTAIVLPNDG
jgi:hypothetical protein